jgi:hypothetical protein
MKLRSIWSSPLTRPIVIFLALAFFLLPGCGKTTIKGSRLLYPKFGSGVDNLQPELRWEAVPGVTYDLAIWKLRQKPFWTVIGACGDYIVNGSLTVPYLKNKTSFYYVEGLKDNAHRPTTPLEPANCYAWSVRHRMDAVVGEWSNKTECDWLGLCKSGFVEHVELFYTSRGARPLPK